MHKNKLFPFLPKHHLIFISKCPLYLLSLTHLCYSAEFVFVKITLIITLVTLMELPICYNTDNRIIHKIPYLQSFLPMNFLLVFALRRSVT